MRRAAGPEKSASRDERNAVFGMRKGKGSERPDRFARRSARHGAPPWPWAPHQLRPGEGHFSKLSMSLSYLLRSIPIREKGSPLPHAFNPVNQTTE